MTRILHVLQTPRAEGTPNLVLDWLAAGRGQFWQGVVVLHADPPELSGRLRDAADAYEEHDVFDRGYGKFAGCAAVAYRAVRRYRPDVVVCWTFGFANWVCAGAAAAGCHRLIAHAGNPPNRGRRSDLVTRYGVWPLLACGVKVVCCSRYVRDQYRAVPLAGRGLFTALPNCVRAGEVGERAAAARRDRRRDGTRRAVMVATLEDHKDHETLLRAVPLIRKRMPNFRLALAGGGSMRGQLETRAAELRLGDAVEFLGPRRDVPELLGRSDLFVFSTTLQEGLGSVLLEALAAGVPVVASDVPACRELLEGGRWGKLVAPADPVLLAHTVVDTLGRPPGAERLRAAAGYAAAFTAGRMLADYLALVGVAED